MQGGNVGKSSTPDRVQGKASDSQMFLGWLSGSFLSIQGKSPVMAGGLHPSHEDCTCGFTFSTTCQVTAMGAKQLQALRGGDTPSVQSYPPRGPGLKAGEGQ